MLSFILGRRIKFIIISIYHHIFDAINNYFTDTFLRKNEEINK